MGSTSKRAFALSLVVLLAACGSKPVPADEPQASAALPVAGPSWVAGDRASPIAGRIAVGLLVHRRPSRRLADLIPKEKLEAFLEGVEEEMPEVIEEWSPHVPVYRSWGPQGQNLAEVRAWFRTEHGVDVEFHEVLANECSGLPIVLAERRPAGRHERVELAAYKQDGGRVVLLSELLFPAAKVRAEDIARVAIRGALKDSPRVHHLTRDPFSFEARREGEHVVVDTQDPAVRITFENGIGQTVAGAVSESGTTARVHAPDPGLNPFAHHVVATYRGEGLTLRRAWSVADLVGTIEREIYTSNQVHAGGVLALRIRTRLSHDSSPAPDQAGTVALHIDGESITSLAYRTDATGYAHPRLAIPPDVAPGEATLVVDDVKQPIEIEPGLRVSVVTDRPLYKQTDEVHVRTMVHRVGDGRPVAGAQVRLSIGNAKRYVTTSEHGIASHTFELNNMKVGRKQVDAVAGGAEAVCAIRVKAFERPTFTLSAEPPVLRLRTGETAAVTLRATYVNGSPLVGGRVEPAEELGLRVSGLPAKTAADGTVRFEVKAMSGYTRHAVSAAVWDADGRRSELAIPAEVDQSEILLETHVLSDLVVGVPAQLVVSASKPAALKLGGVFLGPKEIDVDESGRATITITPTRKRTELRVIDPKTDTAIEQTLVSRTATSEGLIVAFERRTARVGETLKATVLGPAGLAHIDIWKGPTPVLTRTVRLDEHGAADLELPMDARMAGILRVYAHHSDGRSQAARSTLLVTRGRALRVRAESKQPTYAPGTTAEVDVTVRDKQGNPTAAVLGYWGVDEALLALAPMTQGNERIFDVSDGIAASRALSLAEDADRDHSLGRRAIASAFGDLDKGVTNVRKFPVVIARTPRMRKEAKAARAADTDSRLTALWKAYLAPWKDIAVTELVTSDSFRETLQWLVGRGSLENARLVDAWGKPYALWVDRKSLAIRWSSAGPDGRFFTGDETQGHWSGELLWGSMPETIKDFHVYVRAHYDPDLLREDVEETEVVAEEPVIKDEEIFDHVETDNDMPFEESFGATEGLSDAPFTGLGAAFEGPSTNGTIGIGGGAGGSFRGRGGSRDITAGAGGTKAYHQPIHVREDFDPTLCFVPEAIIGPDGKTTLTIPLKDSMTTWRLRLVASSADGAVGVGYGSIRVKQPVHATPWLSPHLTVGDVVEVPIAVRNEEAHAVTARVTATSTPHLTALATPIATLEIGPGGTGRATFRYRANEAGRATLRLTVDTGAAKDVQERVVTVHRNARTVVAVANGTITMDGSFATSMQEPGRGDVSLELYPSPLAEVLSGFEGLISAPHG